MKKKNKKLKKRAKVYKKAKKSRRPKGAGRKIKKVKGKKLRGAGRKAEEWNRWANVLTEKGKKRGFITYDEILKTFPDIENNILFLDDLYEQF